MTDAPYRGHVFSLNKERHRYECEICGKPIAKAGELCDKQNPPKPPAPGSKEWLDLHGVSDVSAREARPEIARAVPSITTTVESERVNASNGCAHKNATTLAPDIAWCRACGSIRRHDAVTGAFWTRPQARSPKEIEAMRAELQAVHSDLGDASQSVFDLFESLREKEIEIARQIAEHRSVVGKMTDTIEQLKRDLEAAKDAL